MNAANTNWRSERDGDDILWLILDKPGTDTNVLSVDVLEELDSLLDEIEKDVPKRSYFARAKARDLSPARTSTNSSM